MAKRRSNPPKTYGTTFDVSETKAKAKAGVKRKGGTGKIAKAKKPKAEPVATPIETESSSESDADDGFVEDVTDFCQKTVPITAIRTADDSAEQLQLREISRLRAELEALKKAEIAAPSPPSPPPAIRVPPSLPLASSDHSRFNTEMTTVRMERTENVAISSGYSDMDRITIQSFQRQARMQADIDIAENEAATLYRAKRRAEAFNFELQMELLYASRRSSR